MKKLFLFVVFLFISSGLYSFPDSGESRFLNFSDIHFDPYYDSTLVFNLLNSDFNEWESIYNKSSIKSFSTSGSDCNYILFKSALSEMSGRIPIPDFILITGDFMSHKFNENFKHFTGIEDPDTLNMFIEKTIRFVTSMIVKYFPGVVIYPSLGNDDAYCGNYMVEPDGGFLKMFSEVWEPVVNKYNTNNSFKKDFQKSGYCSLNFPGNNSEKMILLNTVYFSPKYKNLCGDTNANPGSEELIWLKRELEYCKKKNQNVFLSYHIPPGADIYYTIHGEGNCEENVYPSWKNEYSDEFLKILKEYSSIITAQFAGHFHRDDFRLFCNENNPVSFIHITPSISPIYGNNPSYQIFTYDKLDYKLLDYETYNLSYTSDSNSDHWNFEYSFKNAYLQDSYSIKSMDKVYELINSDTVIRKKYIKFYTSDNENVFDFDYSKWLYNWCGIRNLNSTEYTNCLCKDSILNKK